MLGLTLNDDNDIYVEDGRFARNSGSDRVVQEATAKLEYWLGEWFLNINGGVDYRGVLFVSAPDIVAIENMLRNALLELDSVSEVIAISSQFDRTARQYSAQIRAKDIYGENFTITTPEII